jgi:hypothetical protein
MSASQKQSRPELHVHHHISVGAGTMIGGLAALFVVQCSIVSWVLITNPASLRIFLETMRGAPATSMVPPPYTNGEHTGP